MTRVSDTCALCQAKSERLSLVEEERDFLLQEKDTLVDRLGGLETRQRLLEEREEQAGDRGMRNATCP